MKRILNEDGSPEMADAMPSSSLASMFSAMCKPAYSKRLAEIISDK